MSASTKHQAALAWRVDVPILTEPLYLAGYLKAIIIVWAMMGTLMSFLVIVTDNIEALGPMWVLSSIAAGTIVVAGGLGTALLTGNRMALRYEADDRGVRQLMTDRKLRAASSLAVAAGALAGNPGAAGAGMVARGQTRMQVAWSSVAAARFHPGRRAIALRNSWRTVLIVFCTPDTYEAFGAMVNDHLATRSATGPARRNPLPGLLLRTLVALLGTLPFFVLPWPFELDLFVPLLTLCFALASVWLLSPFVLVSVGGFAWMWYDIVGRAFMERQSSLDGSTYTTFEVLSSDDMTLLALAAIGTAAFVAMGVLLLLGRFPTALSEGAEELEPDEHEAGSDKQD